jgi:ATP adenylyltransferase
MLDTTAPTQLWAPRRMAYVNGADSCRDRAQHDCTFCRVPTLDDQDALILHRGKHAYVVLNRYPYNNGHLMVIPDRHVSDYSELTAEESAEFTELTSTAIHVLRSAMYAQGFNVGMNIGNAGGASVAGHLHQHVVPRWDGDTNFMPVLGQTKVVPQSLEETWTVLARAWTAGRTTPPAKRRPRLDLVSSQIN